MLILFGTRGITLNKMSGSFHCPNCGPSSPFSQKGVRRFFTLFFVPVIPLDQVATYVECHRCRGQFDVNVLEWNPNAPATPSIPTVPGMMPALQHMGPPAVKGLVSSMPNAVISRRSNGMATASLVLGIIGLLTLVLVCPSFVLLPLSLIFGVIGLVNASQSGTGKGKAIAGLICSVIGIGVMIALVIKHKDTPSTTHPVTVIDAAEKNLGSSPTVKGFGNTAQAKSLAESVAQQLQAFHDGAMVMEKGRKSSDKYVVHCELHEKTCAFLVYVPDYRKFTDDAKTEMNEMAWSVVTSVAEQAGVMAAPDAELCVGLRGMVLFGSIMTGKVTDESPNQTTTDEADLKPFFPEKKPTAEKPTEP